MIAWQIHDENCGSAIIYNYFNVNWTQLHEQAWKKYILFLEFSMRNSLFFT